MTIAMMFVYAGGLFAGMLLCLEVGRRIGVRRMTGDAEGARAGVGVVDGAVFALLGLLVAFTFSGAAARFDTRRHLVVEEANAIGTAYLRLDLLPSAAQPALKEAFRHYLDTRLEAYRALPDIAAAHEALARSAALQREIWRRATAACSDPASDRAAAMLLLPALNQMIDITTTRTAAVQIHPPPIIYVLLAALAQISAVLAGYDMASAKTRNWIHMVGFALIMAATFYVIIDLEHPRLGLIRVDAADAVLVEVRENMK